MLLNNSRRENLQYVCGVHGFCKKTKKKVIAIVAGRNNQSKDIFEGFFKNVVRVDFFRHPG